MPPVYSIATQIKIYFLVFTCTGYLIHLARFRVIIQLLSMPGYPLQLANLDINILMAIQMKILLCPSPNRMGLDISAGCGAVVDTWIWSRTLIRNRRRPGEIELS